MTRRPGDAKRDPPGGRAAERLRMFEQARGLSATPQDLKPKQAAKASKPPRLSASKRRPPDAKQDRRTT